ncbi:hypothetical protein [Acaryochloris marina]|uniref:phosphorylase family protein n=1 Tax=Acaryochloris marina TaxID=155978 RepID=UPI001BAF4E46|nr:hypothetical protein [Acaryochloris marina]QUY43071.1 hypothetical protein I1H34_02595 [Acaryochloris marina S15]
MPSQIDLVFVPQGAEYRSVCKGLKAAGVNSTAVVPIPVGPQGVTQFLQQWLQKSLGTTSPNALLMGLGGSLTHQLSVGDVTTCQTCIDGTQATDVPMTCDPQIFLSLSQRFSGTVIPVTGVSCDRIINTTAEKRQLAQTHQADVVDMEGFALLSGLKSTQISLGIVRVISDDIHHDLPDLNGAISPEGHLQTFPLAMGMLRQPLPALRLIRGSLKGLKQLEKVTTEIFKP